MMSPQEAPMGQVDDELVKKRDKKYDISTHALATNREDICQPEVMNPMADVWQKSRKGTVVQLKEVDMVLGAGSPLRSLV